jgi:lysophospholipase L1-like esterase
VLLVLTSLLLALALAESTLRILEPTDESTSRPPAAEGLPVLRTVREMAQPDVNGVYKGRPYRTNAYGFRGPDVELAKPADSFRIAVIGDSITMGEGVAEEDAYPARLAAALTRPADVRFEVLNLGLSGMNLRSSLDLRLPTALRFDPDLIVYGFTINDLEGLPGYRRTRRAPAPHPWRVARLLSRAHRALGDRLGWPGSYRAELTENFFENPPVWSAFEADLERLAEVGARHELCIAVLLHTQLWAEREWVEPAYTKVEQTARASGLHVIPSEAGFEGVDVEALHVGPFDSHPNSEGHRRLTEALVGGLASLPEDCWNGARPRFESVARPIAVGE